MPILRILSIALLAGAVIFAIIAAVIGAVSAFQASIILGIIVLIVQPAPLILGVCKIMGNDIAPDIAQWMGL